MYAIICWTYSKLRHFNIQNQRILLIGTHNLVKYKKLTLVAFKDVNKKQTLNDDESVYHLTL